MENSKHMIERALRENLIGVRQNELVDEEIECVANELDSYCIYLDETSRQRLLYALEWGRIDAAEFKRRALNNDAMGERRGLYV